ncbi:hypothetical protein LJR125_003724 [Pseudoxanthomonas sp. LjRoot125]|uniref:phosphoribosyltransferase-like protein n=1 Tax=Pseudoxanthomonas sp. LjRoot125 TaxID=3342258 RepID=UPI003E114291
MKELNAELLLTHVMGWVEQEDVLSHVPKLQLLATYKYDLYQRFGPGRKFVESLAIWLNQFDPSDRKEALSFVEEKLVFFSEQELSHLVQLAYPDIIEQEVLRLVSEETGIASFQVRRLAKDRRFKELRHKSLYLGLSDGARTNELRRASNGAISNEQIWQAYELGESKAEEMIEALQAAVNPKKEKLSDAVLRVLDDRGRDAAAEMIDAALEAKQEPKTAGSRFTLVWLLDDFSGSGNTYIRYDPKSGRYKGKIPKVFDRLHMGDLVDTAHYEVFLLLYVATRQAIDHIEYWSERFASERGLKPIQVRVLLPIERSLSVSKTTDPGLAALVDNPKYYDDMASDKHIGVGGTKDAKWGFAACALPVVLSHNAPNNSLYLLWAPESHCFQGLFPRVSRHREF